MKNVAIALSVCLILMVGSTSCFDVGTRNKTTSSTSQPESQWPVELLDYETGYYNGHPMIITQWENTSLQDIKENIKISVAFFKGGEEIGQNSSYLHHSVDAPFEQGTNRQINISADVLYSVASWSKNNIRCKVYINNQFYDEFPIEGTGMFFNRIQSNSRRKNSPKNATEQRDGKSNKSSSIPKNTVRFEIINEGIVENIPSKGHIDLDTLNHIWNFHTERENITNLKKWKNNPYHQEGLYLDDNEGDYIIEPWVYALGEDRYYIKFAKNEAGGTEFRITTQSAMQYLKLWCDQ